MIRYLLLALSFLLISAHKSSEMKLPKNDIKVLDEVVDGTSFIANGQKIKLWGIRAIDKNNPYAYPSQLYLETILNEAPFHCQPKERADNTMVMTCFSQGEDIASMLLRQGLAYAAEEHSNNGYEEIQNYARALGLGIWGHDQ